MGIAAIWFYHKIPADFVMTELMLAMMMMMVIVVVVVEMLMIVAVVLVVMTIDEVNMTQTLLCPSKVYYLTNPTKRAGKKVVQHNLIIG